MDAAFAPKACHEGAIGMVDGKAKLLREDYCDGLGDCLPACPTGAITFENREAPAYNQEAVKAAQAEKKQHGPSGASAALRMSGNAVEKNSPSGSRRYFPRNFMLRKSQLSQWPVQIKLVPISAPYFDDANLLVAADCTAYAYGNFHQKFIKNKVTLIGCPKLDEGDYSEKLTQIIANNDIKSVTIVRMEVPCCGGLENAAKKAIQDSGKFLPWQVHTISIDGKILEA